MPNEHHVIAHKNKLVTVPVDEWLDESERERDMVIMRLRQLDDRLIRHGRRKHQTIPRRARW